jgi:hypothetical protein
LHIISHDLKAPLRAIHTSGWIVEDMPEMPVVVSDNFGLLGRVQKDGKLNQRSFRVFVLEEQNKEKPSMSSKF